MSIVISTLERAALFEIFSLEKIDRKRAEDIINSLTVEHRKFSPALGKPDQCCGFYLSFKENDLLKVLNFLQKFPGAQCTYPGLEIGVLFTLFIKDGLNINVLEGSLYGEQLPICTLLQETQFLEFCS